MYRRSVRQFAPAAVAVLFTSLTVSCATTAPATPVVVLPNGYVVQPDKQEQSQIVKRGGRIVVPAPIAAYATSGDVVTGALGPVPPTALPGVDQAYHGGPDTRYFVLDTAHGKLDSNLDAMQWHERLKALGVPSDLEIYPPLPWNQ